MQLSRSPHRNVWRRRYLCDSRSNYVKLVLFPRPHAKTPTFAKTPMIAVRFKKLFNCNVFSFRLCCVQVLLISDPDTDKEAAAVDVRVGHTSDPPHAQGIAHFCEHMLFLGTGKTGRDVHV